MYSRFYKTSFISSLHINTVRFLRNRSCVTQLLSVLHSIGQKLDKNEQTDIVYLDLAKAFDSVDHSILLQKLKCYGVTGSLLNWFADCLNNRRQGVLVDGSASRRTPVTSGCRKAVSCVPCCSLFLSTMLLKSLTTKRSSSSAIFRRQ